MERIVLVHLSDIHMGSVFNGFYPANALRAGLNGHDPILCRRLKRALLDIPTDLQMTDRETLFFVVCGDLTCTGLNTDAAIAYTFLLSDLVSDCQGQARIGLHIPATRLWTIPGNHDHWNGNNAWPQPAYNRRIFPDLYRQTPWRDNTLSSVNGTLRLDLFGVDSNSGLAGHPNNPTAWGQFSAAELDAVSGLEYLLRQSAAERADLVTKGVHQARAVLCHHAFSNKAQPHKPQGNWFSRAGRRVWTTFFGQTPDPLAAKSVQDLIDLAHKYDVKAVLTGHTHDFWEERHPATKTQFPAVWELRSSTAVQGPTPPTGQPGVQGFLLHELRLVGKPQKLEWRYKKYQYRSGQFVPDPNWSTAD